MNAGTFIQSTSLLDETIFENVIILITEYNKKGAVGFVVNKLFPRKLNELEEFKTTIPFPMHDGGPVDQEHLFFIHRRPDLVTGGVRVAGEIYVGGDFKQAVLHINKKSLTEKEVKIFIGYCGWDYGELDAELEEGSWEIINDGQLF